MPILLALIGAFAPRLILFFMWIFDYSKSSLAFDTYLLPVIGFFFLPYTTLMYVFVNNPLTGVSTWGWLWLFLAFMLDIGAYGGGYKGYESSTSKSLKTVKSDSE